MFDWVFYLFLSFLGLIVGSFLNVVIYRYNTGQNIRGRSYCFACRAQLRWFDLIPLISFLYARGRCRSCRSLISLQYPLVELFTALTFGLLAWHYNPLVSYYPWETLATLLIYLVISSILIVIAVYDLRHKIIPDDFVFAFIALAFVSPAIENLGLGFATFNSIANGVLTAGILFGAFWGLWRYSEGRWIGLGDAKLVIGIGLLLGLPIGITSVVLAFWLGAIVGLAMIALNRLHLFRNLTKVVTIKSELPFAPFLVLATLVGLIFQLNLFSF